MAKYLTLATAVLALVAPVRGSEEEEEPKGESCGFRQKIAAGMSLKEVLEKTSEMVECGRLSGYSFLTSQLLPDDDETAKMCHSEECRGIVKAIEVSNPPDCNLHMYGFAAELNFHALVEKVQTACGNVTSDSSASRDDDDDDDEDEDEDDKKDQEGQERRGQERRRTRASGTTRRKPRGSSDLHNVMERAHHHSRLLIRSSARR
ncbi:unnamed protein product [Hyaloperonospora brassicae]|uniref:Elicitin-like protein n=1 Tax=Hyaloperonospora brassicae TaxID=162125 RepID=A0AAV0U4D6_HYABA|nr:unnamed protein product [Hyaloperonospora brassicae]